MEHDGRAVGIIFFPQPVALSRSRFAYEPPHGASNGRKAKLIGDPAHGFDA